MHYGIHILNQVKIESLFPSTVSHSAEIRAFTNLMTLA